MCNYDQCLISAYFAPDSVEMTFLLAKAILWVEDSYFSWKQQFDVRNIIMMELWMNYSFNALLTHFILWLFLVNIDIFDSFNLIQLI